MYPFRLNIKGKLQSYTHPVVMGILNVTPDSFYSGSRVADRDAISDRVTKMIGDGVDIIDVGAYSTRPGYTDVSATEELRRLEMAISAIREIDTNIPVSVDTFRAVVAEKAIAEMGADIINDVSFGLDPQMFNTVARLGVPYILTHSQSIDGGKKSLDFMAEVLRLTAMKIRELNLKGVCDVIIDPGFGFSKDTDQNYTMLENLNMLEIFHRPILVGISRKSMLTKPLKISSEDALIPTVAANTIALINGASILRVHDILAARQAIEIFCLTYNQDS